MAIEDTIIPYTKYELYRWGILIKERDDMVCFCCKRKCLKRREIKKILVDSVWKIPEMWLRDAPQVKHDGEWMTRKEVKGLAGEAHHIKPKYHHPILALYLWNGITLCWRCHRQVIHSTWDTWEMYVFMFKMAMTRKANKLFNNENQRRVRVRRR